MTQDEGRVNTESMIAASAARPLGHASVISEVSAMLEVTADWFVWNTNDLD
jgi:hypothetical protein